MSHATFNVNNIDYLTVVSAYCRDGIIKNFYEKFSDSFHESFRWNFHYCL